MFLISFDNIFVVIIVIIIIIIIITIIIIVIINFGFQEAIRWH